jgi:hypothetical protein
MACEVISASGENKYSSMRRLPVLTVTVMPRDSSMFLPSTSIMIVSGDRDGEHQILHALGVASRNNALKFLGRSSGMAFRWQRE